jgi:hypothetical protein
MRNRRPEKASPTKNTDQVKKTVIPAKTGVQWRSSNSWIPAFAGMTGWEAEMAQVA